jgi:hypothetical protein
MQMDDAIICNVSLAFHIDQFNNISYLLALAVLWSGHISSVIEFCLGSWPGCEVVRCLHSFYFVPPFWVEEESCK